jgi:hypothetical protein
MRVSTGQKIHFLLTVLFLVVLFLPACGPSQSEIDATVTQSAANDYATQTANAPTATLTPTLTPTPTDTPTPTPTITPSPTSTPIPTDTPVPTKAPPVEMDPFVSFSSGFTYEFEFPKDWEHEINKIGGGEVISTAVAPDQSAVLEIYKADLLAMGFGKTTLEEYVNMDISSQSEVDPSFNLITQEQSENANGLPIELIVFTLQDGKVTAKKLIYVHDDNLAIVLTYFSVTNGFEDLLPIIDYTFDVFDVSE